MASSVDYWVEYVRIVLPDNAEFLYDEELLTDNERAVYEAGIVCGTVGVVRDHSYDPPRIVTRDVTANTSETWGEAMDKLSEAFTKLTGSLEMSMRIPAFADVSRYQPFRTQVANWLAGNEEPVDATDAVAVVVKECSWPRLPRQPP